MSKEPHPCEGCGYCRLTGKTHSCGFFAATGQRRPCPPGEACTVRQSQRPARRGNFAFPRGYPKNKQGGTPEH